MEPRYVKDFCYLKFSGTFFEVVKQLERTKRNLEDKGWIKLKLTGDEWSKPKVSGMRPESQSEAEKRLKEEARQKKELEEKRVLREFHEKNLFEKLKKKYGTEND